MADNGRWFKLWTTSLTDQSLSNMPNVSFGLWCKLGAYTKLHGNDGTVTITDSNLVRAIFQVADFECLITAFRALPNVIVKNVSGETNATVSFNNWQKYQGDFSTDRVKKHREKKRFSGNGLEEKRREEKRREEILCVVEKIWESYPFRNGVKTGKQETIQAITDHVKSGEYGLLLDAVKNLSLTIDAKKGIGIKDPQRFIVSGRGKVKTFPWKEYINLVPKQGDPGLNSATKQKDPGL